MTEKVEISTLFKRKDRERVVCELKQDPEVYGRYRCLTDDLKERLTYSIKVTILKIRRL